MFNKKLKNVETISLEIIDMADTGQGVARHDNMVYFVDFAVLGDVVRAEVVRSKKNYRDAKPLELLEPSPFRKPTHRGLSDSIYGLSLEPLVYEKQIEIKEKKVYSEVLKALGYRNLSGDYTSLDFKLNPIISLKAETRYRNKGVFPVRKQDGKIAIGSFARGSHRIVGSLDNIAMPKTYATILEKIISWAKDNRLKAYDEATHSGSIRFVTIRSNKQGEHLVVLTTRENYIPQMDTLIDELKAFGINISGLVKAYKPEKSNVSMGGKQTTLYGNSTITKSVGDSKFKLSPDSFFQVSTEGVEKLYGEVARMVRSVNAGKLWDIYCGVGSIGIYLAKHLDLKDVEIRGIESVESAVQNAIVNAEDNSVNATFECGRAEDILPTWTKKYASPDLIIVDPPRKGLHKTALEAIAQTGTKNILYVSCNPSTLARDLAILKQEGYKILELSPVDLFPMTMHVECIVLMSTR